MIYIIRELEFEEIVNFLDCFRFEKIQKTVILKKSRDKIWFS